MLVWVVITACVAENCCDDVEGDEVDAVVNAVDGVVATDTLVATAAVAAATKLYILVKFAREISKTSDINSYLRQYLWLALHLQLLLHFRWPFDFVLI